MKVLLALSVGALALAALPAVAATEITVENIGSVFNESVALPAQNTPGSSIPFAQYFEFTLPVAETVTVSMSNSAIGTERIIGGVLSLNDFTSSATTSPFEPMGALIESATLMNVLGGQEATVNPDLLSAGAYFVELSGISGRSAIHIAIDGTITATSGVPEPSTWALLATGFGLLAFMGVKRRKNRLGDFA
jgi:PEP-CTERM motif-containing protein